MSKVAVIGAGPSGLTALRCLQEEGFDVTGFERRANVGGLWAISSDPSYTTALGTTMLNISKYTFPLSDHPMPKDWDTHPTAPQIASYYDDYARKFDLFDKIRFSVKVSKITRDEQAGKWLVAYEDNTGKQKSEPFDKVVLCHGLNNVAVWPRLPGREKFQGSIVHGQAFRSPKEMDGKRVLLMGIGNTSGDIAMELRGHAKEIYISHRRGRLITSRMDAEGLPTDRILSWLVLRTKDLIEMLIPLITTYIFDKFLQMNMVQAAAAIRPLPPNGSKWKRHQETESLLRTDLRLMPVQSFRHVNPMVNDEIWGALHRSEVELVDGFEEFTGPNTIRLMDGQTIEVDAVICSTGYRFDWDILPQLEFDGACGKPLTSAGQVASSAAAHQSARNQGAISEKADLHIEPHLPRLYQMMFPPKWADSVAVTSYAAPQGNISSSGELQAMALAQIWAASRVACRDGSVSSSATSNSVARATRSAACLPNIADMNKQVDAYHAYWRSNWHEEHAMHEGFVQSHSWNRFLHHAAGTGLFDNLPPHVFSLRGWSLRWREPDLWKWLTAAPLNNHAMRLFETNPDAVPGRGRKAWSGAREALKEVYEDFEDLQRRVKAGRARDKSA